MASFYLWSIKWSRKSGTEDLDSVGNSFPNSLKLLKDSLRVATKLSYIYISQLQHKMKLKKKNDRGHFGSYYIWYISTRKFKYYTIML